ncbi:MAG: GNAT family N-acetyltransferase [Trueperaceae bacterium]|nr:GNAT family N-acetyltransferase [Trueperaceae bacterium]
MTRRADTSDAEIVHKLYGLTPAYFDIISIPIPTLDEVRTDLATAGADPRRHIELILLPESADAASLTGEEPLDPVTGRLVAGYLDYKLDYPEAGDATVNLLLVLPWLQSLGLGSACANDLEARLGGRSRRLLASIYGSNPRARQFWEKLGYTFAIDARPILVWYAKLLAPAGAAAAG